MEEDRLVCFVFLGDKTHGMCNEMRRERELSLSCGLKKFSARSPERAGRISQSGTEAREDYIAREQKTS